MIVDFSSMSPLGILQKSARKGLGRGNLGVLVARAGVGKTACLIHIAFDKLFRGEKLLHISVTDTPEKVTSYYNVIYYDLIKALNLQSDQESRALMERNRMILAYLNQSFEIDRLRRNLDNLRKHTGFEPDDLIVDGMDFGRSDRASLEGFQQVAAEFNAEVWFSAVSHRHRPERNQHGIPHPLTEIDGFFQIILQLNPDATGIHLNLLKDRDTYGDPVASIRIDPSTFLALPDPVITPSR